MTTDEKITMLRELMKERGIDVYYVPNEDDHLSDEYTADCFKCKSFLSGFTGESGCMVVTQDFAGLWTDGRYFTQAEKQLAGTCVTLMRMRQEGVPEPLDFAVDALKDGGVLGFDGNVVSALDAKQLSNALKQKNGRLHTSDDLAGVVWGSERPAMPQEKLFVLDTAYTGETAEERIARVREAMKQAKADVLVLTALEDPCWMLNIRGNDIECTPVTYAFAVVTEDSASYYVDQTKVTEEVRAHLQDAGVCIKDYHAIA